MTKVYIQDITPELAQEMWARSVGNPRFAVKSKLVNRDKVVNYVNDMRSGYWHENGDTIRFNAKGELIDGHHRIAAVIESGVTIRSIVVEGVTEEAEITVDSNTPRAEYARLRTLPFVPAMIRLDKAMMNNCSPSQANYVSTGYIENTISRMKENIEIIAKLRTKPSRGNKRYMQNAAFDCAFLHAIISGVSVDVLSEIAHKIAIGNIDFNNESALFKLREYCIDTYGARRKSTRATQIRDCCYIQQYLSDYLNGIQRRGTYRNPKPVFTLSIINNQ